MSDKLLTQAADRLDAILAEASPGPWFFNGYNAIFSAPKLQPDETWHEQFYDTEHTLERRGKCPACGGDTCRHAYESYKQEAHVGTVPAWAGDTASAHRVADARLIEAMANPLVGQAVSVLLRQWAGRTDPVPVSILNVARAVLGNDA